MVREKYLENAIFSRYGGKSGNFVNGQGNLERTWKVREKSGNFVDGQENLERTWKVREFRGWPGKFKKDFQSQGKVREFKNTVIDLFSALCAKLFQRGRQIFEVFFFLLSAHFNRLLYIEGNEFKG